MLVTISVLLIFAMLFNVKFHAGVKTIVFDDEGLIYYSCFHNQKQSILKLDFSNVSSKVQRFALLKENVIWNEREIHPNEDINNYEVSFNKLEFGKYTLKLTTEENIDLIEEIEISE